MTGCPEYIAPAGLQLKSGGATGRYDCLAWSARDAMAAATCGRNVVSGRTIRLKSNEPVPDPKSPGLNLPQVCDVMAEDYGVYFAQHVGGKALSWDEYERRRRGGEPMIIQVSYGPIADSMFDAGRGFRDNHGMAETQHSTYDPLADGRAKGVWKHDGRLYPRAVMKLAAARLVIGKNPDGSLRRVGYGKVWCASGRDTAPNFAVTVRPRAGKTYRVFNTYRIRNGVIVGVTKMRTKGFTKPSRPPRAFKWPGHDTKLRFLLYVPDRDIWVHEKYGHER